MNPSDKLKVSKNPKITLLSGESVKTSCNIVKITRKGKREDR